MEAAQCLAKLPDSWSRTTQAPPTPVPTSGSPTAEKGPRNEPYLGQSQSGLVPVRMNVCRSSTFEAEDVAASQMGGSDEGKLSQDLIVHFLLTHRDDRRVFFFLQYALPRL